jgi:hypothetical protein
MDFKHALGDLGKVNANILAAAEAHPEIIQAILQLIETLAAPKK